MTIHFWNPAASSDGTGSLISPFKLSASVAAAVVAGDTVLDSDLRPAAGSPLRGAGYHAGFRLDANGLMLPCPPPVGALAPV